MINVISKECARASYILSRATATILNKEYTPPLFNLLRLGVLPLNNYGWFSCESWEQLNSISGIMKGGSDNKLRWNIQFL